MSFDDARVQRFLGTKDVIVLATLGADGAPLAAEGPQPAPRPAGLRGLGQSCLVHHVLTPQVEGRKRATALAY
jgi:hypothetical protein